MFFFFAIFQYLFVVTFSADNISSQSQRWRLSCRVGPGAGAQWAGSRRGYALSRGVRVMLAPPPGGGPLLCGSPVSGSDTWRLGAGTTAPCPAGTERERVNILIFLSEQLLRTDYSLVVKTSDLCSLHSRTFTFTGVKELNQYFFKDKSIFCP